MKILEFKPSVCKEQTGADGVVIPASFDGSVTLEMPNFDKRYELLEASGLEVDGQGNVSGGLKQLSAIRKMVGASQAHYKAVDLKRLSDGAQFKSFEDLTDDAGCDGILVEVASIIVHGIRPGKN